MVPEIPRKSTFPPSPPTLTIGGENRLTFPAPQLKSIQAVQPGDTLRISFFVHTLSSEITTKNGAEEEGDPARPHQAMLELALKNNPEIRVLRVLKSLNSGKHKLDLVRAFRPGLGKEREGRVEIQGK